MTLHRLLASRVGREYISVVSSHTVKASNYSYPRKLTQRKKEDPTKET